MDAKGKLVEGMTRKIEERSKQILKRGEKNKLQHLKTVQRPYTGSDSARHSNCHRINFWGLNSVYPICLPAWHRLENSPIKSCISPPQKLCINSSHKTRKILSCTQQENTVYAVFLARQDTWDSSSVNGRPNPASPLCPLNLYVCTKVCTYTLLGYMPSSQHFWKTVFFQRACTHGHLLIRSEVEPRNKE